MRALERDDPYTERYFKLLENNVLGHSGVKLQMKVRDPNGQFDKVANNIIEQAWEKWCSKKNCNVTGQLTLHESARIVLRSAARDGGILVRKVKGYGNDFRFAIQLIEIDHLDVYYNVPTMANGNEVRMGVELDQWKKPVAYYLWTRHPGDWYSTSGFKRERISAEEMLHVYNPRRTLQTVGIPWLASSMLRLKMLSGFEEAALVASRAGACQGGFLQSETPEGYTGDGTDSQGNPIMEVEPGTITDLPMGKTFVAHNPAYPHVNYGEYIKAALRGVASGGGVSYNSLANDLEGVNYSSIRAGVMEDREEWKQIQNWLIEAFYRPVFQEWLPLAILSGQIRLPFSKLEKFSADTWAARRWGWVDPLKDIQATTLAVNNLLETRTENIAETGRDIEDVFEQLAEEKKLMEEYDLEPAPMPGQTVIPDKEEPITGDKTKPSKLTPPEE